MWKVDQAPRRTSAVADERTGGDRRLKTSFFKIKRARGILSRVVSSASRRERIIAVAVAVSDSPVHVVNFVLGATRFRVTPTKIDGFRFRPKLPESVRIARRLHRPCAGFGAVRCVNLIFHVYLLPVFPINFPQSSKDFPMKPFCVQTILEFLLQPSRMTFEQRQLGVN